MKEITIDVISMKDGDIVDYIKQELVGEDEIRVFFSPWQAFSKVSPGRISKLFKRRYGQQLNIISEHDPDTEDPVSVEEMNEYRYETRIYTGLVKD